MKKKQESHKQLRLQKTTFIRLMKILIVLNQNDKPMTTAEVSKIINTRPQEITNIFCGDSTRLFFNKISKIKQHKRFSLTKQGIAVLNGEDFDFNARPKLMKLFFEITEVRWSEIYC